MEAKAILTHARISPRKVNIVLQLIRGKEVGEAIAILEHTPKAASELVKKLVASAAANAEHNHGASGTLYVKMANATAGPTLKRFQPRAKGTAYPILKRSSHITIVVSDNK